MEEGRMEAERIKCLSPTVTDDRRLEAVDCEAVVRVGIDTVVAAGARIWGAQTLAGDGLGRGRHGRGREGAIV
jgi:hypothetical protein